MDIVDDDEPKPKIRKTKKSDMAAEVRSEKVEHGDQTPSGSGSGPNSIVDGECSGPDGIFTKFFADVETYMMLMSTFEFVAKHPANSFIPLVIHQCDAASNDGRYGKVFSQCECVAINEQAISEIKDYFPFGAFFGISVQIYDCFLEKKIPTDPRLKKAARKLLTYIIEEEEWHKELGKLKERDYVTSKGQVMGSLGEHFFKRLSLVKGYTIDKQSINEGCCKCKLCDAQNLTYDDTSIGNIDVWHGNLDLIFDGFDIAVKVTPEVNDDDDDDDEDHRPGGRSHVEFNIGDINAFKSRSPVIAQTIAFSFIQKQKQPSSEHFLTPFILASNTSFKVFCYDAQNDILLETRDFEICQRSDISFEAVIVAWLVLNHKLLCTGAYPECLEKAPKSRFMELTGDSLSIYENELSFRNVIHVSDSFTHVSNSLEVSTFNEWFSLYTVQHRFVWPMSRPLFPPLP